MVHNEVELESGVRVRDVGRMRESVRLYFSSRRRHTRLQGDWSSDVCSSDLFEELPQTIVMVVEGAAYGGGLGLMCGGDVVLAAADAKFSISETTLGVPPAQIAPFVAQRIGVSRTRRLSLTAHRFDGREAERIGLVDQACDGTAALDAALAQVLAGIARCSPHANAVTKRLILASRTLAREELLEQSADAFAECLRNPEGCEGVTAFLEKRKPKWMTQ